MCILTKAAFAHYFVERANVADAWWSPMSVFPPWRDSDLGPVGLSCVTASIVRLSDTILIDAGWWVHRSTGAVPPLVLVPAVSNVTLQLRLCTVGCTQLTPASHYVLRTTTEQLTRTCTWTSSCKQGGVMGNMNKKVLRNFGMTREIVGSPPNKVLLKLLASHVRAMSSVGGMQCMHRWGAAESWYHHGVLIQAGPG